MRVIGSQQITDKILKVLHLFWEMNSVRERATLPELLAQEAIRLMDPERARICLLDRMEKSTGGLFPTGQTFLRSLNVLINEPAP